jgi:hypothetical protein
MGVVSRVSKTKPMLKASLSDLLKIQFLKMGTENDLSVRKTN